MYYGINRYLCHVFDEMRRCGETRNYSMLSSLIEEAQVLGNRMEAKLADQKDWDSLHKEINEKKAELRQIKAEIKAQTELKHLTKS